MSALRDLQHDFYDMLMESQYWPAEQLVAYQREQLEHLIRHARANVPFYEHRLDCLFTRHGDIDWDRWHEVPIVKRSDMIEHREAMLARQLPPGHGAVGTIHTSGSTGVRIAITNNKLVTVAANASRWRAHVWHGLDWSRIYTASVWDDPGSEYPHGLKVGPWGPYWDGTARQGHAYKLGRLTPQEQTLEFLKRTGSSYFSTAPKTLHALALEAERIGFDLKLDAVLTHGEHLGEEDRAAYQRVFGARALEHYSSKEGGQMAYPCPDGHGLHVNSESVLVEVVDTDGRPVKAGEEGRVVVTPFVSTAQPLIRYEQGDVAIAGGPCSCGRGLPVLSGILGRTMAIFRHPDGRAKSRLFSDDNRKLLGCTMWQIAQVGPHDFEIRYVPDGSNKVPDEAAVAVSFRQYYFEDANVSFKRLSTIPLTPAGKYIEYINEWTTAHI